MFISRKAYDDLRLDNAKLQGELRAVLDHNKQLQVSLDWMRIRLTQVEKERATMIYNYTGVNVPVPQFEKAVAGKDPDAHPLSDFADLFKDMGDAAAEARGIGWRDDGTLNYDTTNGK